MCNENSSENMINENCEVEFEFTGQDNRYSVSIKSAPFDERGNNLTYDSKSFYNNGEPVFLHSGEMHYFRVPRDEWEQRIIQMKNGGLNCVASYVFWGIHEPAEDRWNFEGRYDIRHFAYLCKKHGMFLHMRIGPLINSETTHGGMPNWVYESLPDGQLFPTKEWYLDASGRLYRKLSEQLREFFPSKGGNIIFIQLDNETNCEWFYGKAIHKQTAQYMIDRLYELAIDAGFEGPFGCTYWTSVCARGALPLGGGYPAGIWEMQKIDSFKVQDVRVQADVNGLEGMAQRKEDGSINQDQVHIPDQSLYPVFGVENQSGRAFYGDMPATFAAAYCLYKIAGGESATNYYVYSGGTNPQRYPGKWFDITFGISVCREVNVMSYDMNAPLSEFGEIRDSYNYIRRLGLLLRDFGSSIAMGKFTAPEKDAVILGSDKQISFRGESGSGFIFANAYKYPGDNLRSELKIQINKGNKNFTFPEYSKLELKRNIPLVMPVNMEIDGVLLRYSSATPLCRFESGKDMHLIFWSVGDAEYCIENISEEEIAYFKHSRIISRDNTLTIISETEKEDNLVAIKKGGRYIFIKTLCVDDSLKAYNLENISEKLILTGLIPGEVEDLDGKKILNFSYNQKQMGDSGIRIYPGSDFYKSEFENQWDSIIPELSYSKAPELNFQKNNDGSYTCRFDRNLIPEDADDLFITTTSIEKGYGVEVYIDEMLSTDQWYREDETGKVIPWSFSIKRFLVRNSRCWVIEDQPDGCCKFLNKLTGKALGVEILNGKQTVSSVDYDGKETSWKLSELESGEYLIENPMAGRFLTISSEEGGKITLENRNCELIQKFSLEDAGELYYKIGNKESGLYLDGESRNLLSMEEGDDNFNITLRSYKQNLKVENYKYSTNYSYGDYVKYSENFLTFTGTVIL